jgi:2'-5' RNA ligase
MIKTFISLGTDESLQRYLSGIIGYGTRELPLLEWVDPASIHFTLAFLDELNDVELSLAVDATQAAARVIPSFTYRLESLLIQPAQSWTHLRMKVENQPLPHGQESPLQLAYRALCLELERRQLSDRNKEFSPHLSLARARRMLSSQQQALQRLIQSVDASASAQPYPAKHFAVMQSERSVKWPKYTCLGEYALAPAI